MGVVTCWRGQALLLGAAVLLTAVCISLVFNGQNRSQQLLGLLLPGLLGSIGGMVAYGFDAMLVGKLVAIIGIVAAIFCYVNIKFGKTLFVYWMMAATPIGWTFSTTLLGLIYYVVVTPIGWIMRLAGHDPMNRKLDKQLPTYWLKRDVQPPANRYFRQF